MKHTLAAAALLALSSLPALAQAPGQTIDVAGWKVDREHNADNSFKQCSAIMTYDDKSVLGIIAGADKKVSVVMIDPAFDYIVGQTYKADVSVDKGAALSVDAVAGTKTGLLIPIPPDKDDAFMAAMMAGDMLNVDVAGKVAQNPLAGSGKAITQLGQCMAAGLTGK